MLLYTVKKGRSLCFLRFYLLTFGERGRERDRKEEKHQCTR